MFLFYVLSLFKKGDTIQGGTLFKGGHYLRKYGKSFCLPVFGDNVDPKPGLFFTSPVQQCQGA